MKKLLKMIELVRNQKEIKLANTESDSCPYLKDTSIKDHFFKTVQESQSFIFTLSDNSQKEIEEETDKLDAPFKVFSIEMIGDNDITRSHSSEPLKVTTKCILAFEFEPKKFHYYVYFKVKDKDTVVLLTSALYTTVVNDFIKRINKEAIGTEQVREKIKLGSGKNKTYHTIRQIIHVRSKRDKIICNPESNRMIDWQQKWLVRGHWLRIKENQIGKDRAGIYCMKGITWRNEHEKGPEGKPLINKVRVVD